MGDIDVHSIETIFIIRESKSNVSIRNRETSQTVHPINAIFVIRERESNVGIRNREISEIGRERAPSGRNIF